MKKDLLKKIIIISSFLLLIGNSTTLFAQFVELEILGGGYKLRGPNEISFPTLTTATSTRTNTVSFSDIEDCTPSQADNNYLMIIDENGGNPFDVTVTATELKQSVDLQTITLAGSTTTDIKVADSNGFLAGDTFLMPEFQGPGIIYQIASVPDINTLVLTSALTRGVPSEGLAVNLVIDCYISPKKCISLSNFAIRNGEIVDTIYGGDKDFAVNAQTNNYTPFKSRTITREGSNGNELYIEDASQFIVGEQIIFPANSGVEPIINTMSYIDGQGIMGLTDEFITAPSEGVSVESINIRNLSLGSGNGAAPGQWKIYPFLQNTLTAGQLPGTYQAILNFTIV